MLRLVLECLFTGFGMILSSLIVYFKIFQYRHPAVDAAARAGA